MALKFNFVQKRSKFKQLCLFLIFKNKIIRNFFLEGALNFIPQRFKEKVKAALFYWQDLILLNQDTSAELNSVVYGRTSRICLPPSDNNEYQFNLIPAVAEVRFGIAFYQDLFITNKNTELYDLLLRCEFNAGNGSLLETQEARFPIGNKKHGVAYNELGRNWINIKIDDIPQQAKQVKLAFFLKAGNFLAIRTSPRNKPDNEIKPKSALVAMARPRQYSSKRVAQKQRKIVLFLSVESFTDPHLFFNNYELEQNMPHYCSVMRDSFIYKNSYSPGDGTLSSVPSLLTGLHPSAHLYGDYDVPEYEYKFDTESMLTLAKYYKDKSFYTVGLTTYPRLNQKYGWSETFCEYYNNAGPFHSDAPDSSLIIRHIDSNRIDDLFFFVHFSRLHLPLMSNDDKQAQQYIGLGALDKTLKYDYEKLYKEHLSKVDYEIGRVIEYLKSSGQYESSSLIITGDHGVKMPPYWKAQIDSDYDLYEGHVRVPLLIKPAHWNSGEMQPQVFYSPVSAHLVAFNYLCREDTFWRDHYSRDADRILDFEGAITETIYHPKKKNFSHVLVTDQYKYWAKYDIDWMLKTSVGPVKELLFFRNNPNESFNEFKNIANSDSKSLKYFRDISDLRVKKFLSFNETLIRKKFPLTIG